ncbi:MAG: DUF1653 domain-containing protein [Simkaniaceae bacterium]|nr:DUF1653 domain-containing protein [Simkaniaceae bacterium]
MSLLEYSQEARSIEAGSFYTHFKGMEYKVLSVARHSETLEELVVYQALYGQRDIWVRPLKMFLEKVTIDGKSVSRFNKKS